MGESGARPLVVLAIALATLLVVSASLHIGVGPPYERGTVWLALVFACSGATVGLLGTWTLLASAHWAERSSFAVAGSALFAGGWTLFAEWNAFLIWQMIVLGLAEAVMLIVFLGIARLSGASINSRFSAVPDRRVERISIQDLLKLTVALALLAAVLGSMRPVGLSPTLLGILIAGGFCAGLIVLVGCWAVAGHQRLSVRAVVALLVAPSGGLVYAVCARYERLLLSSSWYAQVTCLQTGRGGRIAPLPAVAGLHAPMGSPRGLSVRLTAWPPSAAGTLPAKLSGL